jgi:hypothetical protein
VLQVGGRRPNGLNYALDLSRSDTRGSAGDGFHGRVAAGWNWDYWFTGVSLDRYDRNFIAANGLVPQDLPGTRGASAFGGYYRVFGRGPVYAVRGDVTWTGRETLAGELQQRSVNVGGTVELQNEIRLGLYYFGGDYRPVTAQRGVFSSVVNDDRYWTASVDFNTRNSRVGYGLAYANGQLGGGEYRFLPAYLWLRPIPSVYIGLSSEVLKSFGTFDQTLLTVRWDLTGTDAVGARFVRSNEQNYYRFSYGRQVRAGVDIFAVIDRQPNIGTQFSLKLLMTFL